MLLHCIGRYLYICRPVCIDSRGWRSFFILLHLYSGLGASHSQGNFPYNLSRIISHKITTITVGPFRNWMYFGWNLKIGNWNFQWNATTRVVRLKFSAASSKTQTWTTNSGRQISLPVFFCIFQLNVFYFAKTQPVSALHFFHISHFGILYLQPRLKLELLAQLRWQKNLRSASILRYGWPFFVLKKFQRVRTT